MPEHTTDSDLELLDDLGVDTTPTISGRLSAREQRIIQGFEDIKRFFEEQGRIPCHGENRDIFERLYAVRLDRIRESPECCEVLKDLDAHGLLKVDNDAKLRKDDSELDDEALLASLGVDKSSSPDIINLKHVRSRKEINSAEEIAQRVPCKDFDKFKSVFKQVQRDLEVGQRRTVKYQDNAEVREGDLFILDGQKVLVVDLGEMFVGDHGRSDCRIRAIYDNGTESALLMRSLQRSLNKDSTSRRITVPDFGPLFSGNSEEGDTQTGSIYVLRSKSDHPFVAEHRAVIHKIGVTGGDVKKRIANAKKDPTYLLADVEIVAEFKLANIDRKALEVLLQKFFSPARLDLELKDRFGGQVEPREWFLVARPVIDEVIEKIKEGTLGDYRYDRESASLKAAD
jgi:hypothetical protein